MVNDLGRDVVSAGCDRATPVRWSVHPSIYKRVTRDGPGMDVSEAIDTRIEVRSYREEPVDGETRREILEAGRQAPSGRNLQHWRFILVADDDRLDGLGERSPTGGWVADADFAVVVCTDPTYDYHDIDAGRAVTHMQFVAWERGVASCLYTVDDPAAREFLEIPDEYDLTLVAGFGYPAAAVQGVRDRKPLAEVAFEARFGGRLDSAE